MHQLNVEMVAEQPDHLLAFTGAHHAGIDIDTSQLFANGLMQQHRDDRTVNAAGQTADNPPLAHLRANIGNRFIAKRRHRPIAFAAGNFMGEVLQHFGAIGRMHHFRVKLHAVNLARLIGNRRIGRIFRCADNAEPVGQIIDAVAMAHPDLNFISINALKERRAGFHLEHGATKFALI